jgi:hypothetical protein
MKKQLLLTSNIVLVSIAALSLGTGATLAQGGPSTLENHYKVYEVLTPATVTGQISLIDQWGDISLTTIDLEKFAIPAEKILPDGTSYPIVDPFRHYTWWAFQHPELVRRVDVLDQFGGYSWRVRDSRYLLTPAAKNEPNIPDGNHYKCYEVDDAPTVDIVVGLVDQVDSVGVIVLTGELFCNPVEKTVDGITYPIFEPDVHLTCYRVQNDVSYNYTAIVTDQFGERDITIEQNTYLCLPAEKGPWVGAEPSTWGRIKALFSR